jgi:pSer/pThr/pTyr-binding forkhead associated (FHA) protein
MVQLRILSGQMAGDILVVRHFPFCVGRAAENDLCLSDDGIWDYHFMLEFQKNEGFMFQTFEEAFATVNDQPQKTGRLRNGDVISFGSAKIQFWLAAPRQRGLRFREWLVWALLAAITAAQIALIYWLIGAK